MYAAIVYDVPIIKRTSIEIDQQLLDRAKQALHCMTTRGTVEEALRSVAKQAQKEHERQAAPLDYFMRTLPEHVDLDVWALDEMWR